MDKGPICTVSCVHYEDKPAVPPTTYECDIQGKWHPELPFCATPGSGIIICITDKFRNNILETEL